MNWRSLEETNLYKTKLTQTQRDAIDNVNRRHTSKSEEADFPELKVFYEANQPTKESLFTNTKPTWGKVNKLQQGNMFIFEVALENPDRVGITSKELSEKDMESYQNLHNLKLVLFVDTLSGKTLKGCYMAVEANSTAALAKVHYRQTNGLNGKVVYYNMDGSFSNGVVYIDGKPRYAIQDVPLKEMMALKKQGKGLLENDRVVQGTCYTVYTETGYTGCIGAGGYQNCQWYPTGYSSHTVCNEDNTQPSSIGDGYDSGGGSTNGPPLTPECTGKPGGTAYIPIGCTTCIGGETGLTACPPSEEEFEEEIENKPFALFADTVDCEQLKKWLAIAKFIPDSAIFNKLTSMANSPTQQIAWIQSIDDAHSTVVNMEQTFRPNWKKVKAVIDGTQPLSTLSKNCL